LPSQNPTWEKKTEAYVDFIGSLDAQIDRYDKEIRRLNAMKKQAEHLNRG
jgi:hypothetical protein